jgi:MOSC domain-containing protein YiiM
MSMDTGIVKGLAVRPGDRQPLVEIPEGWATVGKGIQGDDRAAGKRGITFICAKRWADTMTALGADLPWHTRRANVLVEGVNLAQAIGRLVRVGDVEVRIWAETCPCDEMDEFHAGLKEALKPETRGGVYGEVLTEGRIRVGDPIIVGDAVAD